MRARSLLLLWLAVITDVVCAAPTCDEGRPVAAASPAHSTYVVSGILRKINNPDTIKLVHSVEEAVSANEARGAMIARVGKEFPDFGFMDTLVSLIPVSPPQAARCGAIGTRI